MAIIKCHECKGAVSDQAVACPHCGAPVQKITTSTDPAKAKNNGAAVALLLIIGLVVWGVASCDEEPKTAEKANAPACKKDDLQCLGDQGTIAAGVYCPRSIEQLAKHSVKWTDGTFESKFSRFRWKNKDAGEITFIGDKAEFQNGFGAFTPVTYFCDMAADNKTILDVRVMEGRLP